MSKSWIVRLLMGLCLSVFAFSAVGCETTEGAGRDLENAGDAIEDAAD